MLLCIFGEKAEKAGMGGHTDWRVTKGFAQKLVWLHGAQYYTIEAQNGTKLNSESVTQRHTQIHTVCHKDIRTVENIRLYYTHTSKSASKVFTETNECNSGWAARGLLKLTVSSFKHFQEYIFNLQTKPPSPPLKWNPIQSRHYPSSLRIGFKSPMRGINQNLASLFEENTVICWFNNQQKLPEGKTVFLPGHLYA